MKCPYCSQRDSRVVDTREVGDGIRRRRECLSCKRRFTSYERIAPLVLFIVKRDGRREEFSREKLSDGIRKACTKRPISNQVIEEMVDEIESQLYASGETEIESRALGEIVMERLKKLDDVAYVRFASVYRRFKDVDGLIEEAEELKRWKERTTLE
jgi:transcriptional repressor NrdR